MNLPVETIYKCCSLVPGFGGSLCDCVGPEACDAYHIYHGCSRFTEIFEGLNTGSTLLSRTHVKTNDSGPTEIFHCKAENGKANSNNDEAAHSLVEEEEDKAAV